MLFVVAAALAGMLSLSEGRTQLKAMILSADAIYLEGFLRRRLHNQNLPDAKVLGAIPPPAPDAYRWLTTALDTHGFVSVAHKGGLEHLGTNSLNSLNNGYRAGFRLLEIDFLKTNDNRIVCGHHWPNKSIPTTLKEYTEPLSEGKGRPCTLDDVIRFTNSHRDIFIILDIKSDFEEAYRIIIERIEQQSSRDMAFVPQVYSFQQLALTRRSRVFAGEIFTAYRSALTSVQIYRFAEQTGVQAVTMPLAQMARHRGGTFAVTTFIHPVNDFNLLKKAAQKGIKGIYTSYLSPPVLEMAGSPQQY